MYQIGSFEPLTEWGRFDRPFRNIRATLDDTSLSLLLIPAVTSYKPSGKSANSGGHEILESDRALRLDIADLSDWVVQDESNCDSIFKIDAFEISHMHKAVRTSPILLVKDSEWLSFERGSVFYPEHARSHMRIISMTTIHDVVGWLKSVEWVTNDN